MTSEERLPPGASLNWTTWKALNRLRSGYGQTKVTMKQWGYLPEASDTSCDCGDTSISTSTSPSQASHQKNDHSSSPPSPSRTSATHHTSYNASSVKLKSRYSTRHQTRFKHHYKHTRTNRTHKTRLVFTAFPANAAKYTSERQGATYLQESRNTKHTAD